MLDYEQLPDFIEIDQLSNCEQYHADDEDDSFTKQNMDIAKHKSVYQCDSNTPHLVHLNERLMRQKKENPQTSLMVDSVSNQDSGMVVDSMDEPTQDHINKTKRKHSVDLGPSSRKRAIQQVNKEPHAVIVRNSHLLLFDSSPNPPFFVET